MACRAAYPPIGTTAFGLGEQGESVFVAFQLRYALAVYLEVARLLGARGRTWAQRNLERWIGSLHEHAWDGEWYLRAYRADGFKFGSRESSEGRSSSIRNPGRC